MPKAKDSGFTDTFQVKLKKINNEIQTLLVTAKDQDEAETIIAEQYAYIGDVVK